MGSRAALAAAAVLATGVVGSALAAPSGAPWAVRLVDVGREAGLVHPSVYGGVDRKRFIIETNGAGAALVDVDGDGRLDALVQSGTRLRDGSREDARYPGGTAPVTRLYRNLGGGRFTDVSAGSGLDRVGWATSVCVGDYDGDARVDLFFTYYGSNVLYRNLGGGRFADATAAAGLGSEAERWSAGCSFLDYDRDGDLDLFVSNYLVFDRATVPDPGQAPNCFWKGVPVACGPKGLPHETNLLYRNDGGRFRDVSALSGVAAVTGRYSMTAVAADFDEDGWVDIYVASDSTAAILYRNNRDGTFTDVAVESGTAYSEFGVEQAGMGVAVGDFDRDGRVDLSKTHFADDIPALYRNLGRGLFQDVALAAGLGVENRYVQWGTGMPDLDNDGWPDLVFLTGSVYPEVESHLARYSHKGPCLVFRNLGDGRFEDVTARSGPGTMVPRSSRGAAFGDVDEDGDVDILVMNMNEPPALLRNDHPGGRSWLQVELEGQGANRLGLGATVVVSAAGRRQARVVLSQSSYGSHDDLRLHFGLGEAEAAEAVEVRWPSGQRDVLRNVRGRRRVRIREGESPAGPDTAAGVGSAGAAGPPDADRAAAPEPAIHPRVAEAWRLLQQGDAKAARRAVEAVLADEPRSGDANYVLGAALERQGDLEAAAEAYRAALRHGPGRAEAHDRLGFVLGRLGRTAEAITEFREAVRLEPGSFDAQYHLGATLWWTKDLEGAVRALRAAAELDPDHAAPLYYLGRSLRQSGRAAEALEPLERAVRVEPAMARAHLELGLVHQELGDAAGAVSALRRAVELAPDDADTRNSLGLALIGAGEAEEAVAALRALARSRPDHTPGWLSLGNALLQKGDLEGAIAVYEDLVARAPSAEAFHNLGTARKQRDDFVGAEEALRAALRLDPKLADAHYTLGVVLWQTGRAEAARPALLAALEARADFADAHQMLGTVLRQLGDRDGAVREFRAAIALRPQSAEAHLGLGQLLQARGETAAARAALDEAARLRRQVADAQAAAFAVGLGRRRHGEGDLGGAIESFREALRLAPESADAHYRLALALRQQGAASEAATHFAEARRLAPYLRPPIE